MSTRHHAHFSSDEDVLSEPVSFRHLLAPSHIISARMHQPHPSPKPEHASTLDRRQNGKAQKQDSGQYGTLPRHSKSTYAKLRTVATFTNMYFTHKEAADEELNFLRAVENGDIEEAREILEDYNTDVDSSDTSADERVDIDEKPKKVEICANGKKPAKPALKKPKETKLNGDTKEPETVIEMDVVESRDSPSETKPSVATRWALAKRQKRASKAHLPVITTTRPTTRHSTSKGRKGGKSPGPDTRKFNKNCRDEWGRSALFIAMLNRDRDMMTMLLSYKVEIDECLYHAIDFGFYDIVELFMEHDTNRQQVITGEDSFYPAGLTPIQLAAHKNDYVMLKILHSHGFKISSQNTLKRLFSRRSDRNIDNNNQVKPFTTVLEKSWDASNNKILYYRARASPAYMIMMFTEGDDDCRDFLENIFGLYRKLKKKANTEPTARSLYVPLAEQVEDFACDLLSEVRSPSDLADLLRFDPPGQPRKTLQKNYLAPMQRGFEVRMKRFVAHDNCQLALSCIRQGTLFESEHGWRTLFARAFLSIIFPFLCLAFIVAPDSKVGSLLRNPMVNLGCHMASEIMFVMLIDLRLIIMTYSKCDCLGMQPSAIEWLLFVWIIARFVDELKKFREVPFAQNFTNQWRLNDVGTTCLFALVIILKIVDVVLHNPLHQCPPTTLIRECNRDQWFINETVLISLSEACLAFVTILIHIRALELLYIDRTFGPLQLSLDKMIVDTIRFLFLFVITFFACALAMTQLYWAYGEARIERIRLERNLTSLGQKVCEDGDGFNDSSPCSPVYSSVGNSLLQQYWTLYGYGWRLEPPVAVKIPEQASKLPITEWVGLCISMFFHLWAVVIMLNMLIAMMSHSFDRVRDNAEVEWKYHRSGMWMKFIRKGIYPRPPPMNLIPSPRDVRNFLDFIKKGIPKCCLRGSDHPKRSNAQRPGSTDHETENHKYRQSIARITNRYLRRYLLPDFKHDDAETTINNRSTSQQSYRGRHSFSNEDCSSN
uniref:Short transient receptor potential channel 5 n=1 Tax=Phallusia mammillata TaxID=59560 RepID=A0A6F9DV27_9ASCI|nr:short transient receptor potential channel 5 [Phallusia mammillata]